MAAAPPPGSGQPLELALQLGGRRAPRAGRASRARGPTARLLSMRTRSRAPTTSAPAPMRAPTASPDIRTPRRVATSSEPSAACHAMTLKPPLAFQSSRVRASHAQAPAHRGPPRIHRRRPNPHEPRKPSHRRRSREQLSHRFPFCFSHSTDPDSVRLPDSPHRPAPAPGPSESPADHQQPRRTTRTRSGRVVRLGCPPRQAAKTQ